MGHSGKDVDVWIYGCRIYKGNRVYGEDWGLNGSSVDLVMLKWFRESL